MQQDQLNMQMQFVLWHLEAVLQTHVPILRPVSCHNGSFVDNQRDFRDTSGVYLLGNRIWILYLGGTIDSLGHRTFQRLQAIQAGQYGRIEASTVLGLQAPPQFVRTLEWVVAEVYRSLFGRLPKLNQIMPPRPPDWRIWRRRIDGTDA